jgi:hypothetical protein
LAGFEKVSERGLHDIAEVRASGTEAEQAIRIFWTPITTTRSGYEGFDCG